MSDEKMAELRKLSDTAQTVAERDDDIRGRDVKDRDGNDLGKVDDLLIDPEENKVRFLVVASGGFLGIGETNSFIPVETISRITSDEVHLDQKRDHVAEAPAYDPDLVAERDFYQSVYSYYGYQPYWTPGYVYPAYPFPPR
ncbi:PRC-barrel domain-containing protein [Arthrobacter sp. B6]|uniref:PRC-barrel domain-containing protein n=1 Tax=Arthrobacter sp. B6 TaxID=1570137 RepID=UPI000831DCFA|nr:PRC-barrel domain-containing protein [Arthrobacter sp. B6]